MDWARFVQDDTQAYRGRAGRALVDTLRRQVDTVVATVKEEGTWVGSTSERVVRSGPGGEQISNAATPDLLPVEVGQA